MKKIVLVLSLICLMSSIVLAKERMLSQIYGQYGYIKKADLISNLPHTQYSKSTWGGGYNLKTKFWNKVGIDLGIDIAQIQTIKEIDYPNEHVDAQGNMTFGTNYEVVNHDKMIGGTVGLSYWFNDHRKKWKIWSAGYYRIMSDMLDSEYIYLDYSGAIAKRFFVGGKFYYPVDNFKKSKIAGSFRIGVFF